MKKFKLLLPFLLVALAPFLSGCSTTEPDNMSERPWNAPQSWEHGLPGGMIPPH